MHAVVEFEAGCVEFEAVLVLHLKQAVLSLKHGCVEF